MSIALLIASIAASVIGQDAAIPAQIKSLVTAISSALTALVKSGVTSSVTPTNVLAALAGVIESIKALPNMPQPTLDVIASLDAAVAAAIAADKLAQAGPVDPTQVQPIQPV